MSDPAESQTIETSHAVDEQASLRRRRLIGMLCGLLAAIGYTLTNMALRYSSRPADFDWSIWVTAHKAIPATLMTWCLVARNYWHGRPAFPPAKLIVPLIATGLVMQFGGNLSFQYALSLIGLAMTVPIVFAFILVSGAVFSRMFLNEPISLRSLLALTVLIGAVTILSLGAEAASSSIIENATAGQMLQGVFVAMISGTAYGIGGVSIRRNVKNLPVSATLVLISTTGVICVGTAGLLRIPTDVIMSVTWSETAIMLLAGVFNAGAFYCIGVSYQFLNVNQVNMINTTQIAMATVAGILFFSEPITVWLVVGVLLTIGGLYLMDRR